MDCEPILDRAKARHLAILGKNRPAKADGCLSGAGGPLLNIALVAVLKAWASRFNHEWLSRPLQGLGSGTNELPHEVAELALPHADGDKVELAYRRRDLKKQGFVLRASLKLLIARLFATNCRIEWRVPMQA